MEADYGALGVGFFYVRRCGRSWACELIGCLRFKIVFWVLDMQHLCRLQKECRAIGR